MNDLPTFADFEKRLDAFHGSLVHTPIFDRKTSEKPEKDENYTSEIYDPPGYLEIYKNTIKKKISIPLNRTQEPPDRSGTEIEGFSTKSRARLRHTAINAFPDLISQFCMTYHNYWPIDGRELKNQISKFKKRLRRKYSGIAFLYIYEFQTRNAPHVHFFMSIPATVKDRHWLAEAWNDIADPGNQVHLKWHRDRVEKKNGYSSFIPWEMGSGSYLCKYLEKDHQKAVPDGFRKMGRFWGCSRGLVPPPDVVCVSDLDKGFIPESGNLKPSTFIIRSIGRYHEKQNPYMLKFFPRSRFRDRHSYSVLTGAPVFWQLISYLSKSNYNQASP